MPKSQVPQFATVWPSTAEAIDDGMATEEGSNEERRIEWSPCQGLTLTPNPTDVLSDSDLDELFESIIRSELELLTHTFVSKSQVPLFATVWSSTAEATNDRMATEEESNGERRIEGSPCQGLTLTPNLMDVLSNSNLDKLFKNIIRSELELLTHTFLSNSQVPLFATV